jgi:hypothetical protein
LVVAASNLAKAVIDLIALIILFGLIQLVFSIVGRWRGRER